MLPSYILLTAIGAQFIYILTNWYFFKRKEYGFYSAYILLIGGYFLNKYLADNGGIVHIGTISYQEVYPDKILAIASYMLYFKFGRHFLEAAVRYPFMNRIMKYVEWYLAGYILVDAAFLFVSGTSKFEESLFLLVNLSIFSVLVYIFRTIIKKNDPLDRFILTGSLTYALSALITMWLGQFSPPFRYDHILCLQIGTLIEMICLNVGLVYKSKMLQTQTIASQQQLIDQYSKNQELLVRLDGIREKISRDLHDDVGATLSSIKAYSEIIKTNSENSMIADLIKENSSEMIERLEVIAWATDPQHDSFRSLKNHITRLASQVCNAHHIKLKIENNVDETIIVPGEVRQAVFLGCKEIINNLVKYANASECFIVTQITVNEFQLQVCDNGGGMNPTVKGGGNGLKNIRKRAEELNGYTSIWSEAGKGTKVIVHLPYPFENTRFMK